MNKRNLVWDLLVKRGAASNAWLVKNVPIDADGLRGRVSELRREHSETHKILYHKGVYILQRKKNKTLWERFLSLFT